MFKPNEGKTDRIIRVILGLIISMVAYFQVPGGSMQVVLYIVSLVSLITGLTGFCGLYKLLSINTCPIKK